MILSSASLRCPAPAKINLFLHVTGRRADGYHLLQSAFRLIDHGDVITLGVRNDGAIHRRSDLPGVPAEQDLVVRAARLLQEHTGSTLGVDIDVEKVLPMGGGLGGGSSDAASVLLGLNRLWSLGLSRGELQALGLRLGADVPFFIYGRSALVQGVGEQFQPIDLAPAHYVVIEPPVSVPTQEIFSAKELTRDTNPNIILGFLVRQQSQNQGMYQGSDVVLGNDSQRFLITPDQIEQSTRNDLQSVACGRYPQITQALEALQCASQQVGGVARSSARMSGSGACVFLPCDSREQSLQVLAALSPQWRAWSASALDEHPLYGFAV